MLDERGEGIVAVSERSGATNTTQARANALANVAVDEFMHPGVLTCPPETSLLDVARMMAIYRVHGVVVYQDDQNEIWGVVSDADLVAAAAAGVLMERTAGETAGTPAVTVERGESVLSAAQEMASRAVTHAVVVSSLARRPIGMLSSLDLARAIGRQPWRQE
jgi:CBS domain-containing protein